MLGRRHITRGGLWTWWGSERENIPNDAEFETLLRKVFFGSLRTSGEVEEVGLGKEVDIAPYGYFDATGTFHSFSVNMDKLVEKVKEYMDSPGATAQERLLYAFDYMRDLIGMGFASGFADHSERTRASSASSLRRSWGSRASGAVISA